jgi:hypothetical protein
VGLFALICITTRLNLNKETPMARTPNLRQNAPKPAAPKPISLPKVQSVPFTGNSGHPKIPSGRTSITDSAARHQVRGNMDTHRLPTRRVDGVEKVRHDVALHAVRRQMEGKR